MSVLMAVWFQQLGRRKLSKTREFLAWTTFRALVTTQPDFICTTSISSQTGGNLRLLSSFLVGERAYCIDVEVVQSTILLMLYTRSTSFVRDLKGKRHELKKHRHVKPNSIRETYGRTNQVISYGLGAIKAIADLKSMLLKDPGDISRKMSVSNRDQTPTGCTVRLEDIWSNHRRIVEIKLVRWERIEKSQEPSPVWFSQTPILVCQAIIVSKWSPGKQQGKFSLERKTGNLGGKQQKEVEQADTSDWNDVEVVRVARGVNAYETLL